MRLYRSQYTLAEKIAEQGILVNTLTGALDEVNTTTIDFVRRNESFDSSDADVANVPFLAYLTDRGYFVHSLMDERKFAEGIGSLKKEQARRLSQPKYMFGVSLRCNLACSYCWQVVEHGSARQKQRLMTNEMINSAFDYIDSEMRERPAQPAFISLFGGEPLMPTAEHRALILNVGEQARARGHDLHVTSNGRCLAEFVPLLSTFGASVQVTVDGALVSSDGEVRLFRAGQELPHLFNILREIATTKCLRVFVRFLAGKETVSEFAALAGVWFSSPTIAEADFELAVAPVQNKSPSDSDFVSKLEILQSLIVTLRDSPYASRISYVDWRSLSFMLPLKKGTNELMEACFYHCEANISLTAFGNDGNLYCCYEGIGNIEYAVGRYWPYVSIDDEHLRKYRDRDAFAMPQCSDCSLSPICGGGCEVRGHKHTGDYMHPYCDGLHTETSWVIQNWYDVSKTVIGDMS